MSVLTAMLVFWLQRQQKNRDKITEDNAEKRKKESLLSLQMMSANNQLSYAVAMAVKRGYANGEVEAALAVYNEANSAYKKFREELAADIRISA